VTKIGRPGILATFSDSSPGIADVQRALPEGWTRGIKTISMW